MKASGSARDGLFIYLHIFVFGTLIGQLQMFNSSKLLVFSLVSAIDQAMLYIVDLHLKAFNI